MLTTAAETARTLATGNYPGRLRVAWHPAAEIVAHITDEFGQPIFLLTDEAPLSRALRNDTEDDIAAVLHINVRGTENIQLWISGWAAPLRGVDATRAADVYAEQYPVGHLLDLGRGATLYRIEVAEVRLARGDKQHDIDVDEYYAATGREQDSWPLRAH